MTLFFSAKVSINFLFPLCGLFVTIRPTKLDSVLTDITTRFYKGFSAPE